MLSKRCRILSAPMSGSDQERELFGSDDSDDQGGSHEKVDQAGPDEKATENGRGGDPEAQPYVPLASTILVVQGSHSMPLHSDEKN